LAVMVYMISRELKSSFHVVR